MRYIVFDNLGCKDFINFFRWIFNHNWHPRYFVKHDQTNELSSRILTAQNFSLDLFQCDNIKLPFRSIIPRASTVLPILLGQSFEGHIELKLMIDCFKFSVKYFNQDNRISDNLYARFILVRNQLVRQVVI